MKKSYEKSKTEEFIKNYSWNFIKTILSRFGGLVITIILARILLPELFGIYGLTFSIALIFLTFADLGINETLIRYVSYSIKRKKQAASYLRYLFKLKLIFAIIISGFLLILAYPLAFFVFRKPLLLYPLLASALFIFIFSFEGFFESILYSLKKVRYSGIKEIFSQSGKIIILLVLFFAIGINKSVYPIFIAYSIVSIISIIYLFYCSKKLIPEIYEKSNHKINKKRVLKFLTFLVIGSVSVVLYSYVDIIMLGLFVESDFIGFYKAAASLAFGIVSLFASAPVVLPIFTQTKKDLGEVANKILKFLFILSIPSALGLLALGKYFISMLYGAEYSLSVFPMYFLSIIIALAPLSLFPVLLSAREKTKYIAKVTLLSLFANICFNLILILVLINISQLWAINGVAIATASASTFYYFIFVAIVKKKMLLKLKYSNMFKPIFAGIIMFASLFFINKLIEVNLITGILEIVLAIIVYFLVLLLIKGISTSDFKLLKFLFRK